VWTSCCCSLSSIAAVLSSQDYSGSLNVVDPVPQDLCRVHLPQNPNKKPDLIMSIEKENRTQRSKGTPRIPRGFQHDQLNTTWTTCFPKGDAIPLLSSCFSSCTTQNYKPIRQCSEYIEIKFYIC
jgi:hypothetical protein